MKFRKNKIHIIVAAFLWLSITLFNISYQVHIYINFRYAYDDLIEYTEQNNIEIHDIWYYHVPKTNYKSLSAYYLEDNQFEYLSAYWTDKDEPTIEIGVVEVIVGDDEDADFTSVQVPQIYYGDVTFVGLLDYIQILIYGLLTYLLFKKSQIFCLKE